MVSTEHDMSGFLSWVESPNMKREVKGHRLSGTPSYYRSLQTVTTQTDTLLFGSGVGGAVTGSRFCCSHSRQEVRGGAKLLNL